MITVRVVRERGGVTFPSGWPRKIMVTGHAEPGETGVMLCASVSGMIAMARRLIGGTKPVGDEGGSYSVYLSGYSKSHRWFAEGFIRSMQDLSDMEPFHLQVVEEWE